LFLDEKPISSRNNELPLGKGPRFPEETYVLKLLVIIIISYLFLYRLTTYHWKALEENYNFVVQSMSITTHMEKL
jgi:hypothetical protein